MKLNLTTALVAVLISLSGCTFNINSDTQTEESTHQSDGPEYNSKYICPMHCQGSGSNEKGSCPVCKMDYVINENFDQQ